MSNQKSPSSLMHPNDYVNASDLIKPIAITNSSPLRNKSNSPPKILHE
jgi:hypothetical protein